MPFIPPGSIARSVSGLTGKDSSSSSLASMANKGREERGGSVKERLSLNLKQLGRKGQAEDSGGTNGGTEGRRRLDKISRAPKQADSITRAAVQSGASKGNVKGPDAELRSRLGGQEEAHFTLTLTPEAVLLLQRRSSERHQKVSCAGAQDTRVNGRRRDNTSKRPQPGARRRSAADGQLDIRSILKVSLLNDRHKYDDEEYEDEEHTLDQRVALKCTEWLRGLEGPLTAVTAVTTVTTVTTAAPGRGLGQGTGKSC